MNGIIEFFYKSGFDYIEWSAILPETIVYIADRFVTRKTPFINDVLWLWMTNVQSCNLILILIHYKFYNGGVVR